MQSALVYALSLVTSLVLNSCERSLHALEPVRFQQARDAAAAPVYNPVGELVQDWQMQKKELMRIADAMPERAFGYKPTPAQRTFGEQILHIVESNLVVFKMMGAKAPAPAFDPRSPKTKAQTLAALEASYDYGTAVFNEQTADSLKTIVQTPFAGPCTLSRLAWQMFAHSMDIYGQMAVYLRLNGIVPPASRRP